MRQLPLEFGEVTRDHRHVEASENRLLWLAVEQETEGRLQTALGRMPAGRQPFAHFTRHRDVVTSHALSFTNDHFEIERDALANASDLDHGDLSVVEPPETGGTVEAALKRFPALYGGTWRLEPNASALQVTMLGDRAAQIYVPVLVTIGAAGQPAQPTRFLMNMVLVETPSGWRVSSILPIPAPAQ